MSQKRKITFVSEKDYLDRADKLRAFAKAVAQRLDQTSKGQGGSSALLVAREGEQRSDPTGSQLGVGLPLDSPKDELRAAQLNDENLFELAKDFGSLNYLSIGKVLIEIRDRAYSVGYRHGSKDAIEESKA